VDGKRFDELTQRLGAIRLSRKHALRSLVGGVTTLAGGAAVTGEVEARRRKKPICHCGDAGPTCTTQRVKRKQRRAHLSGDQCDYLGECRTGPGGITACAAAPIFIDLELLGRECSGNSACGGRDSGLLCDLGLDVPVCVPIDLGNDCTNNGECSTGRCQGGKCVDCPEPSRCGSGASAQCCSLLATCGLLDVCVL
jgi:hypothetical protein